MNYQFAFWTFFLAWIVLTTYGFTGALRSKNYMLGASLVMIASMVTGGLFCAVLVYAATR